MEGSLPVLEAIQINPWSPAALYHKEPIPHPIETTCGTKKPARRIKTLSSATGWWRWRIQRTAHRDKQGEEQNLPACAQRDWTRNIENDQKIRVATNAIDRVEAQQATRNSWAEEQHTTLADRKTRDQGQMTPDGVPASISSWVPVGDRCWHAKLPPQRLAEIGHGSRQRGCTLQKQWQLYQDWTPAA